MDAASLMRPFLIPQRSPLVRRRVWNTFVITYQWP